MADRVNVLGVGIGVLNIPLTVVAMDHAIEHRSKGYICITNVHSVSEAQDRPALRAIFNNAFLATPDGMPLVWLGRLAGHPEMDRVYGPDLLQQACRVSAQTGWRHFFYGGAPGVAELLASCLQARYPHLRVVGTYTPPFRPLNPQEKEDLQRQVASAQPDIIWVGIGMPKQEAFMADALPWLDTTLMVGVGAAFDFFTGRPRAGSSVAAWNGSSVFSRSLAGSSCGISNTTRSSSAACCFSRRACGGTHSTIRPDVREL
jgi:N-acetylglucosaminyldiphosphoundecaprenol N-acetyl-beta-D-mannosaminyltransferase